MKLKWSLINSMLAIMLLLSACGTTDSGTENKNSDDSSDTPVIENEVTDDEVEEEEVVEEEVNDEGSVEESVELEEIEEDPKESSTEEDESTTEDELVTSDNQNFSMNLLANYELSSEEPGRDIVYPKEDDFHFMRIETMENEEGNYDYLKDNMLVLLEASSNGETPVEVTDTSSLPSGDSITKALAYEVNAETGPVTGIIFEKDDLVVRLTIFDSENEDYFTDFLDMGKTVTTK